MGSACALGPPACSRRHAERGFGVKDKGCRQGQRIVGWREGMLQAQKDTGDATCTTCDSHQSGQTERGHTSSDRIAGDRAADSLHGIAHAKLFVVMKLFVVRRFLCSPTCRRRSCRLACCCWLRTGLWRACCCAGHAALGGSCRLCCSLGCRLGCRLFRFRFRRWPCVRTAGCTACLGRCGSLCGRADMVRLFMVRRRFCASLLRRRLLLRLLSLLGGIGRLGGGGRQRRLGRSCRLARLSNWAGLGCLGLFGGGRVRLRLQGLGGGRGGRRRLAGEGRLGGRRVPCGQDLLGHHRRLLHKSWRAGRPWRRTSPKTSPKTRRRTSPKTSPRTRLWTSTRPTRHSGPRPLPGPTPALAYTIAY